MLSRVFQNTKFFHSAFILSQRYITTTTMTSLPAYLLLAGENSVNKPVLDDRQYRFIRLNKNGLKVLLINDPATDKAAAALDVHVGSFADKEYDVNGLAHFCEHLLFMGTEKYPEENEYSSYLAKHLGHSNAFTASEHTNYYFELSSDHLEGALDRFSQFFISPLFSPSCKDREIKAVDSENKKNLQSDVWRLYQLDKLLSNKKHPYNGFLTGNFETLHEIPLSDGRNVRDVLLEFYELHYLANLMSLVILGTQDLDTLTKWAVEKFENIPNKDYPAPNYNGEALFTQDQLTKLIRAKPIMDTHKLEVVFMIPDDQDSYWDSKPARYLSHLLGHESEGSLLYFLKNNLNWVNGLSAGNMKVCQGTSLFYAEFQMTPQGLQNWQQILVHLFEYLKLVTETDPQQWLFAELAEMSEINFRFRQKLAASRTVSLLAKSLWKFGDIVPSEHILDDTILRSFDAEKIQHYASYFTPDNFRASLTSQTLDNLDLKERWYGTEYSYTDIPQDLLTKVRNVELNNNFHLPIPNEFIPENFEVKKRKVDSPLRHPFLIEDNTRFQIWHKQDDQFEVPKGTIELFFHLPSANNDPVSWLYTVLYCDLIEDALDNIRYYASLVGLAFQLTAWRDGFVLKVQGYNDKLPLLLYKVIDQMIGDFAPEAERFELIKFKISQALKNSGYEVPYAQIGNHFLTLVNDKTYTSEEKLEVLLSKITYDGLIEFISKQIFSQGLFTEGLILGNFDIKEARSISNNVSKKLEKFREIAETPEKIESVIKLQTHTLPKGEVVRFEELLADENNINSCIEYYYQIDSKLINNDKVKVLNDLLATIIHEPCFNQLRTKEQLGYVVFSGVRSTRTTLGFRILIQSERETDYLEYRIEEFLEVIFRRYVNEVMTDDDFDKFKQALKDKKLTKLKNLGEEFSRLWGGITDGYFDFESRWRHVELLLEISKSDFVEFYNGVILKSETPKLIVHLKLHKPPKVTDLKQVQSSIHNFVFRKGLPYNDVELNKIIDEQLGDHSELAVQIAMQLEDETLADDILTTLESDLANPVPAKYPQGKLITSHWDFKSTYPGGGVPTPVAPLQTFYYPESDAHL